MELQKLHITTICMLAIINKYAGVIHQTFNCVNQKCCSIYRNSREYSKCFNTLFSFLFKVSGGHLSERWGHTLHHTLVHAEAVRGHHVGRHVQRTALHPTRCGWPVLHRSGWNIFWVSSTVVPAGWLSRRSAFDSVRAAVAVILAGGKHVKHTGLCVCVCHFGYTSANYTMAFIAVSFCAVEECKGQVENDETSQWKVTEKIMSPLQIMICVGCTSITELGSLTELCWRWQSMNIHHPADKTQNVELEG